MICFYVKGIYKTGIENGNNSQGLQRQNKLHASLEDPLFTRGPCVEDPMHSGRLPISD